MDHSNHQRISPDEYTSDVIEGATIYGPGDENVGTVDHYHGSAGDALIVFDVGGFLGIGAKRVALPARDLDFMRDENGTVHATTSLTEDQLKDLPEHTD